MEIFVTLLIMLICLIAEGFFSGSEIGVVSADRMKLRHDAAKGSKGAKLALEMLQKAGTIRFHQPVTFFFQADPLVWLTSLISGESHQLQIG